MPRMENGRGSKLTPELVKHLNLARDLQLRRESKYNILTWEYRLPAVGKKS